MRRVLFPLLLLVIAGSVFGFRVSRDSQLEPRIDQAHCARWIQDIRRADHLWPRREEGQSFGLALEQDRNSVLHHLGRRIFNQGIRAFNLVSLGILWTCSLFFGDSYRAHNLTSILASCGTIVLAGLFPLWSVSRKEAGRASTVDLISGLVAGLATASSFYLGLFSAWGWHNIGALLALLAVAVSTRVLAGRSDGRTLTVVAPIVAIGAVAFYSHYTVLFFLPAATAFAILVAPGANVWERVRNTGYYGLAAGLVAIPGAVAVLLMATEKAGIYATLPEGASLYVMGIPARAVGWFSSVAQIYSLPGLALGLLGLVLLGVRNGAWLPVLTVGCHWVAWSVLPGFSLTPGSLTWLRTSIYVIPLLAVGLSYCAVAGFDAARSLDSKSHKARRALIVGALVAVAALVAAHSFVQITCLMDDRRSRARVPEFHHEYLEGQGTLRPFVHDVQRALPEHSALVTWTYALQDVYASLADPAGPAVSVLPALDVMSGQAEAGGLTIFLEHRGIRPQQYSGVFLLAGSDQGIEELTRHMKAVGGQRGLGWSGATGLAPVASWDTKTPAYRNLVLYRLDR